MPYLTVSAPLSRVQPKLYAVRALETGARQATVHVGNVVTSAEEPLNMLRETCSQMVL